MQQRKKIVIISPLEKSMELRLASDCASFVPLKNALMFIKLPLFDDLSLSYKHTNYYIMHIISCALQL